MVTKVCYVGEGFTRKPPKYERFIRPMVRHILFAIISFSHGTHSCEQKNAVNDFFFLLNHICLQVNKSGFTLLQNKKKLDLSLPVILTYTKKD